MRLKAPHVAAIAIIPLITLGAAACGDDDDSGAAATTPPATTAPATTPATPTAPAGGASTVTLSADPDGALAFDTDHLTAKAGTVTLKMTNPSTSGLPHAVAVEGNGVDQDGETVQPGGVSIDTVNLKPGTYTFYCPVGNHEAEGMEGTLVVS